MLRLEDQDRARVGPRRGSPRPTRLVVARAARRRPRARGASRCRPRSPRCTPRAPASPRTDWPQILTLYDALLGVWPSPVVALNRAVALAMVDGPEAGLDAIAAIERDGRLAGYRYLPSAKADLLLPPRPPRGGGRGRYREALALRDGRRRARVPAPRGCGR